MHHRNCEVRRARSEPAKGSGADIAFAHKRLIPLRPHTSPTVSNDGTVWPTTPTAVAEAITGHRRRLQLSNLRSARGLNNYFLVVRLHHDDLAAKVIRQRMRKIVYRVSFVRPIVETMDTGLTHTISLLGVAIIVAIIVRRMRLPYTVGLVLTGQGLALAGAETGAMLTHDFIFEVILPPLLFEAALSIRWRELRRACCQLSCSPRLVWSSQQSSSRRHGKFFGLAYSTRCRLWSADCCNRSDSRSGHVQGAPASRAASAFWWRVKAFSMMVLQRSCLRLFLLGHRRLAVRS